MSNLPVSNENKNINCFPNCCKTKTISLVLKDKENGFIRQGGDLL